MLVVAATVAALSWYVTEGPRGRTLPRWLSNTLVLVAGAAMIVDVISHPQDMPGVLGRFTIWLMLIKLYERRSARDHGQLMSLSVLLMLIGCAQQPPRLLFAVVLLLYGLLGVYVLLLYRLYSAHETMANTRREADPDSRLGGTGRPVMGRHAVGQLRGLAGAIAFIAVVFSIVIFVIFPRSVGRGMLAPVAPIVSVSRMTGYTDEVNLISGTRINESPRICFRVQLRSSRGEILRPQGTLLLRGSALETYRNRRWTSQGAVDAAQYFDEKGTELAGATEGVPLLRQEFTFLQPTSTIFSAYLPVFLSSETPITQSWVWADQTLRSGGRSVPTRHYTVDSILSPTDAVVGRASSGRVAQGGGMYWSRRGRSAQQVRRLAVDCLRSAGLPSIPPTDPMTRYRWYESAAAAFATWLQSPDFRYTLDLSDVSMGEDDPIAHFLSSSRRGHCEYFASGLVALCHTVRIPARLVAGYAVSEYDEENDVFIGRAWNAHAWAEIKTGRYRYRAIDPTPAAALAAVSHPPEDLAGRFGWIYEQMEGAWNDRFVEFDETAQADLFDTIDQGSTQKLGRWWESVQEWMAQLNRSFYLGSAGYIWLGIVGLALGIALVAAYRYMSRTRLIRRTLRLRQLRRRERRRYERQLGFYLDMLQVLHRAGVDKPEWQSPLAYAGAMSDAQPGASTLVRELTGLYYRGRYGEQTLSSDELSHGDVLLGQLATTLGVRR